MKLKILAYCLLFVTIFFSCKKEEIGNINNNGNKAGSNIPLLSKVLVDKQSTYEYIYNDSNLVNQEKSKFNLAIYTYNDKGQRSEEHTSELQSRQYLVCRLLLEK